MFKISIVIPVYKVPFEYLDKCIDSVVNQTYKDFEAIIVDDGSPIEWAEKCDEYTLSDNRIRVIHKKNGGLSDARNKGLADVKTEWVTFVDGDDWIEHDFLEKFVNHISEQSQKSEIYYFSGYRNYPNKEVRGIPHFPNNTVFTTYEERENLQTKCFTNHIAKDGNIKGITVSSAWAKVYDVDFLKRNNLLFPIVPYDEDSLYYLETIEVAHSIEYIDYAVYHYRFTEGSIVNRYRPNAVHEQEVYLGYVFDFIKRNNKSEAFKEKAYMRVMTSMLLLLKQYFFHEENKMSIIKKHSICKKCFSCAPYKTALKKLNPSIMRKNARIKFYLLKLRLYAFVEGGRKFNQKKVIN